MSGTYAISRVSALTAPLAAMLVAACGQMGAGSTASAPVRDVAASTSPALASATPVVVELYQSQGCSSCPPANANLNAIFDRPDVLALSFAVTYWDRPGWKDIFARPEYTDRQWDYARAADRENVATPEVVINGGRTAIIGHDRKELDAAIATAGPPKGGPSIGLDGNSVALTGQGGPAIVWLVRYDPKSREVAIRGGENGLGEWTGAPVRFALPRAERPGFNGAVLVQQGQGGPITAARRV